MRALSKHKRHVHVLCSFSGLLAEERLNSSRHPSSSSSVDAYGLKMSQSRSVRLTSTGRYNDENDNRKNSTMTSVFRRSSSLSTSPVLRQLHIDRGRIQVGHTIGKGLQHQHSLPTRHVHACIHVYIVYLPRNQLFEENTETFVCVRILGQFGRVCKGFLIDDDSGNHRVIAIKTLKCE